VRVKQQTESQLVSACLAYLKAAGVLAWRSNNTGIYDPTKGQFRAFRGLKGVSDIIGVAGGGRLLAVECKTGRGVLSADQTWFLGQVDRLGGVALVVRDVGELIEGLKREESRC
jgi:hypothetical protein